MAICERVAYRKGKGLMYTFTGYVKEIQDVQQVTRSFKKQVFLVEETEGSYTRLLPMELKQSKVDELGGTFGVGDLVTVRFEIDSNAWQKTPQSEVKYFISLSVDEIEVISTAEETEESDTDIPF